MRIVLASRSPRRREILGWLGVEFDVVEPAVEELSDGLEPAELVLENARRKARAGAGASAAGATVLGVDTEVFLDGRALGQPGSRAEAAMRLRALSGREHEVLSGLCLALPDGSERSGVARSAVTFTALTPERLELYLDSQEWRGRAGGYAIQGLGSVLIERLEGDFSNVVGLPIGKLLELAPELLATRFPQPQ